MMPTNKVAFVVQRYGLEVNGGAEYLCRLVAEHMSKYFDVEVITTCAVDYMTWKNEYSHGSKILNGVLVRRFQVDFERNVKEFNEFSKKIYGSFSSYNDEIEWMKRQGPYSSALLNYIKDNEKEYDFFIFFTYLYCTTFFGLPLVKEKAILVPTAHDEPPIYLSIFDSLFKLPQGIIYNTEEEKKFVLSKFQTENIRNDVIGIGIDIPEKVDAESFIKKYQVDDFIIFVGRIDESKGCRELFDYFIRYKKEKQSPVKLVLLGKQVMDVPKHPDILPLGFVSEIEKFNGIKASKMLVMPSKYESLSIVLLESWFCSRAVLVNGECDVLKGQCVRSNGGLWYTNYYEFKECLDLLHLNERVRSKLGENGNQFTIENYGWDNIESKYLRFLGK